MTQTYANYGWLRTQYNDVIRDTLTQDLPILGKLEDVADKVDNVVGGGLQWAINTGRLTSFHATKEGATLPAAGTASETTATVTPVEMWGRTAFSVKALAMTKSKPAAFASVMERNIEALKNAARQSIGRQVIGNKISGTTYTGGLGLVNGAVADPGGTSISVDNCNPAQFYVGQKLLIGTAVELDADDGTVATVTDVATLTASTCTLTVSETVILADNDIIVEGTTASDGSNGYNRELVGLYHIVDSAGQLFTVNPASVPGWKAIKHTVSDEPWSEKLLNKLLYAVELNAGRDKRPDILALNKLTYLEFEEDKRPDRRYQSKEMEQGFEDSRPTYTFGDYTLEQIHDPWMKYGDIMAVNTKVLGMAWPRELGFLDEDGQTAVRVANKAEIEVAYGGIGAMIGFERHCHGLLTGIAVDLDNVVQRR